MVNTWEGELEGMKSEERILQIDNDEIRQARTYFICWIPKASNGIGIRRQINETGSIASSLEISSAVW